MKTTHIIVVFAFLITSCGIYSYPTKSFYDIYTISIERVLSNVKTHSPTIGYEITGSLEDKISKHPDFELVDKGGDFLLSGLITNCTIKQFSVGANGKVYLNRVTLELNIQLVNKSENKTTNRKVTVFADYDANRNYGQIKDSINSLLSEKAAEEIYNELFLRW